MFLIQFLYSYMTAKTAPVTRDRGQIPVGVVWFVCVLAAIALIIFIATHVHTNS